MQLSEILIEGRTERPDHVIAGYHLEDLDTLRERIQKDARHFFSFAEHPLYRGDQVKHHVQLCVAPRDRTPTSSDPEDNFMFNIAAKMEFGVDSARQQSLFCTGDRGTAVSYGHPTLIFPVGKFDFLYVPGAEDTIDAIRDFSRVFNSAAYKVSKNKAASKIVVDIGMRPRVAWDLIDEVYEELLDGLGNGWLKRNSKDVLGHMQKAILHRLLASLHAHAVNNDNGADLAKVEKAAYAIVNIYFDEMKKQLHKMMEPWRFSTGLNEALARGDEIAIVNIDRYWSVKCDDTTITKFAKMQGYDFKDLDDFAPTEVLFKYIKGDLK